MNAQLSVCDSRAQYGQTPASPKSPAEQTGWSLSEAFMNYVLKVRRQNKQAAKEAEEDALMAVIDAMNDKDKESKKTDMTGANSLAKAGRAINERYGGDVPPSETLTVQVMLACLGDRFTFEQVDEIQENTEEGLEQKAEEEKRLEVTQARDPSETGSPDDIERR